MRLVKLFITSAKLIRISINSVVVKMYFVDGILALLAVLLVIKFDKVLTKGRMKRKLKKNKLNSGKILFHFKCACVVLWLHIVVLSV